MRRVYLGLLSAFFIALCLVAIFRLSFTSPRPTEFGVSFSPGYAEYLGLEPRAVFRRMITELPVVYVRLSAPWDDIQPVSASSTFAELDWYMDEAARHKVLVTLVIGQKTPRWPECHVPDWAQALDAPGYATALKNYLVDVVLRYKKHPALEYWQVENEAYFTFGACPHFVQSLVPSEFDLVREHDPFHARLSTDSGELSLWRSSAHAGELFGTTLYRTVWTPHLGYIRYDYLIPAAWYRLKAFMNHISPETALVAELQAEPWIPSGSVITTPVDEQFRSMSATRLVENVRFAQKIGFPRIYLWGVEWWYYLSDIKGDKSVLSAAEAIFSQKE